MSRAVIDQAGFRVVFIGFILSLIMGLGLRAQIAPQRVKALLQDSVSRLDKDFIIDFTHAEVLLSNWGLPLPSLQISNIRISPKKSACQDSQIFIQHLNLPLSLLSLITSESLITDINASRVELRVADLAHCFDEPKKVQAKSLPVIDKELAKINRDKSNDNHFLKTESSVAAATPNIENEKAEVKNIFESKTAALLKRINIDELKIIYKKYPAQSIDLRHVVFDLGYENNQLSQIDMNSQLYALKDVQSDVMYFKGDLGVQIVAKKSQEIDTVVKLNGRLLDGEIQLFALANSVEKNVKLDMKVKNVAAKTLAQLNLVDSSTLNLPVTIDFRGYGFYQYDVSEFSDIKLNDIEISGDKTKISIDELAAKIDKLGLQIQPFKAEIQKLNLSKIVNLSHNKNVSQSIENLGEFTGALVFKNKDQMAIEGKWSDLEFIFANRGYRELEKLDSFDVKAKLEHKVAEMTLNHFVVNKNELKGESEFQYNIESGYTQAKAELAGPILNEKVWALLTQVPQSPNLNIHWNYKKNKEERHQLNMAIDQVNTYGLMLQNLDFNFSQTLQDGLSSNVLVAAKASHVKINPAEVKLNLLTELFNQSSGYSEPDYTAEALRLNLKGVDWRTMNFDLEAHLKTGQPLKSVGTVKAKGGWSEHDFISGVLSIQGLGSNKHFQLIKNKNSDLGILSQ